MINLTACFLIVLVKCTMWSVQGFCWWSNEPRLKVPLFSRLALYLLGSDFIFYNILWISWPLQSITTVKYEDKQTSHLWEARQMIPLIWLIWGYRWDYTCYCFFFYIYIYKTVHLLSTFEREETVLQFTYI